MIAWARRPMQFGFIHAAFSTRVHQYRFAVIGHRSLPKHIGSAGKRSDCASPVLTGALFHELTTARSRHRQSAVRLLGNLNLGMGIRRVACAPAESAHSSLPQHTTPRAGQNRRSAMPLGQRLGGEFAHATTRVSPAPQAARAPLQPGHTSCVPETRLACSSSESAPRPRRHRRSARRWRYRIWFRQEV